MLCPLRIVVVFFFFCLFGFFFIYLEVEIDLCSHSSVLQTSLSFWWCRAQAASKKSAASMVGQALEQFLSYWAGFCTDLSHKPRDAPERSRVLVVWISERLGRSEVSIYLNPPMFHSSLEAGGGTLNIFTQVQFEFRIFLMLVCCFNPKFQVWGRLSWQ